MFVPSMGLTLRAAGQPFGCPNSIQSNLSNLRSLLHHSLRQIQKKPLAGLFLYLAERVGFEPTVGVNPRQFSRLLP
jgi:hypothetical protein